MVRFVDLCTLTTPTEPLMAALRVLRVATVHSRNEIHILFAADRWRRLLAAQTLGPPVEQRWRPLTTFQGNIPSRGRRSKARSSNKIAKRYKGTLETSRASLEIL